MIIKSFRSATTCLVVMTGTIVAAALAATVKEIDRFEVAKGIVFSTSIGSDGKRFVTGSQDGKARVWHLEGSKSEPLATFDDYAKGMLFAVASSPDSGSVAFAGDAQAAGPHAVIRQVGASLGIGGWVLDGTPAALAVDPKATGPLVAVAGTGGVSVRDVEAAKTRKFSAPANQTAIAWRGDRIASGGAKGIAFWDSAAAAGAAADLTVDTPTPVAGLAFASKSGVLFAGGDDGMIRVVNSRIGKPVTKAWAASISTASASADGSRIAVGGATTDTAKTPVIGIWDGSGEVTRFPTTQPGDVTATGLSRSGQVVAWASAGASFGIANRDGSGLKTFAMLPKEATAIAPIPGATSQALRVAVGYADGKIELRNASDGTLAMPDLLRVDSDKITALALDAKDASTLYSASADGLVFAWNLATGTSKKLVGLDAAANSPVLSLSAAGFVAAGTKDGQVAVWDATKNPPELRLSIPNMGREIGSLTLADDGAYLVFQASEKLLHVWDVQAKVERQTLAVAVDKFAALAARSGSPRVLTAGAGGSDVSSLPIAVTAAFLAEANSTIGAMASDDVAVYVGLSSGSVQVYEADSQLKKTLKVAGSKKVVGLATAGDGVGRQVFALRKDEKSLWGGTLAGTELAVLIDGLPAIPTTLAPLGDGRFVALGFPGLPTVVYDLQSTATPKESLTLFSSASTDLLAPLPDGRLAATSGTTPTLWRVLGPRKEFATRLNGPGAIFAAAWLGGHTRLVLGGDADAKLRVWDVSDLTFKEHDPGATVSAVATSDDGQLVASGGADKLITVATSDLTKTATSAALVGRVNALAFQPGTMVLASGTSGKEVQLWECNPAVPSITVKSTAPMTHDSAVKSVSFSPSDKNKLASLGLNGVVIVWDVSNPVTPTKLAEMSPPTYQGQQISWSPDGKTLIVAGSDGAAHRIVFTP